MLSDDLGYFAFPATPDVPAITTGSALADVPAITTGSALADVPASTVGSAFPGNDIPKSRWDTVLGKYRDMNSFAEQNRPSDYPDQE